MRWYKYIDNHTWENSRNYDNEVAERVRNRVSDMQKGLDDVIHDLVKRINRYTE